MKKLLSLLGLSLAASTLVLGTISVDKKTNEVKATEYETYIKMEDSFFTTWPRNEYDEPIAGYMAAKDFLYWPTYAGYKDEDGESYNYPYYALDTFFCGETKEGWTGTLSSRTWIQTTQYVYFQLGGAKDYDHPEGAAHLKFHYGSYEWDFYNNTFIGNPLLLRYFKIPDEQYNTLKALGDDFDMSVDVVDPCTGNYGFVNFGYLHVNQSEEQVGDAMRFFINNLKQDERPSQIRIRKQILENYYLNDSLKEIFLKTASNVDEDFESNEDFLNHWYFDWQYYNGASWDLHFDRAIGTDSVRPEESTNMPFNKTGNGFFRGWYESNSLGGFVTGNEPRYRFVSRPFVLSGTGLISIKMAGSASLHVINVDDGNYEKREDLVWADSLTFKTEGDASNLANSDFNTVTMVRHLINLEAYVGRKIQLAIADVSESGWGALYADELVTYYPSYPSFKVDTFTQTNTFGTFCGYLLDQYINSNVYDENDNKLGLKYVLESNVNKANDNAIIDHVDSSDIKKAWTGLLIYYNFIRTPDNEFSFDNVLPSVINGFTTIYNQLTGDQKAIVDNSTDIQYNNTFTSEWYKNPVDVSHRIGEVISQLIPVGTTFTVTFDSNGGSGDMPSIEKEEGSTYSLPDCEFTAPDGYKFIGWKVNGAGDTLEVGEEITIDADTTLVAQWELIPPVKHTISFNANGGSGTMDPVEVNEGSDYYVPECTFTAPKDKKFVGWKIANEGNILMPLTSSVTVHSDLVFYAQWEYIQNSFTISFDSNGGTGSMANVMVSRDEVYTLPTCKFGAPEGHKFAGWKVGNDEIIRMPNYQFTVTSDLVIIAQWSEIPIVICTISFDSNGGTGTMESLSITKGEQIVIPACTFTAPEGKEFAGWLIGPTKYQPGEKMTVAGDTIFKASWKTIEQDRPEEQGKDNQSEQNNEEAEGFAKVWEVAKETFVNLFKKIVEFFQKLFA